MAGTGGLFVEVGMLLLEARTRRQKSEGPAGSAHAEAIRRHMWLLADNTVAMCVDVFACPDCPCRAADHDVTSSPGPDDLLLERWTVSFLPNKPGGVMCVDGRALVNAMRSQVHFSQVAAWESLGGAPPICYRLSHPTALPHFSRPPNTHCFPVVQLKHSYLKVTLKSLPRLDVAPKLRCSVHSAEPVATGPVSTLKSVFADLGHSLLDPPSRLPAIRQGLLAWRDKRNNVQNTSPKLSRSRPTGGSGMVDDRMQCGCNAVGKHHCQEEECCSDDPQQVQVSQQISEERDREHANNAVNTAANNAVNNFRGRLNPLKRKRSHAHHTSKKVVTEGAVVPLIQGFQRLSVHDFATPRPPSAKGILKVRTAPPVPCPPPPLPRKNGWTDSSSEDTECESPVTKEVTRAPIPSASQPRTRYPLLPLLGSYEESLLKGRLCPEAVVEGFTADVGASGSFCPKHLSLPATVSYYPPQGTSTPFVGWIRLQKKGYHVPRCGTVQVTLLNPLGTVVKMFVVPYDVSDMPPNCQTFLRQRIVSLDQANRLRYLIHLRFMSSKSGRILLHSDIQVVICRQYDMDATLGPPDASETNLKTVLVQPSHPKYSPRK